MRGPVGQAKKRPRRVWRSKFITGTRLKQIDRDLGRCGTEQPVPAAGNSLSLYNRTVESTLLSQDRGNIHASAAKGTKRKTLNSAENSVAGRQVQPRGEVPPAQPDPGVLRACAVRRGLGRGREALGRGFSS